MGQRKRILESEAVQGLVAAAGALYIRLVRATTRWRVEAPEATARLQAEQAPLIACFWHGRLLMMPRAWRCRRPFYMLVSDHRDGMLIARAIRRLGYRTVMVSKKRGPVAALRALRRKLREGHAVGITPDGPLGPRMRARPGAVRLAQISGTPIVPVTYGVSRRRLLSTWDRFCLALPLSRGLVLWGEPLWVRREADAVELERLRGELEGRLNALTAEADRRFGHATVEPAPVEAGGVAAAAGGGTVAALGRSSA